MLPLVVLIILISTAEGVNITYNLNNKSKRTLSQYLLNYGETKPILVYRQIPNQPIYTSYDYDNLKPEYNNKPTAPLAVAQLVNLYRSQSPFQKASYEYPNSGYINQLSAFNGDRQQESYKDQPLGTVGGTKNFIPAESVLLPVEQRQNINYAGYNLVPLRKYGNEKPRYEVYNSHLFPSYQTPHINQYFRQPPTHTATLPLNHQYNSNFQTARSVPIVNYINRNYSPRKLNLNSTKYGSGLHSRNTLLHRNPSFSSLKTHYKKFVEPKREEEDISTESRKAEKDKNEKKSTQRDEESTRNYDSDVHPYNFEDSDYLDYKDDQDPTEDDHEPDSRKGSTTHIALRTYPNKHSKNGKVKVRDYFKFQSSNFKQEQSDHKPSKKAVTTKSIYKPNYPKEENDTDDDSTENKYLDNIPVTRRHRLLREKIYFSKNINGTEKE